MSHADRTPSQKAKHQADIARLYLQGHTQSAIALALDIDQSTVSRDLKDIRAVWRDSAIRDFDEAKTVQLAKIDALEATHWEAWMRSLTTREVVSSEIMEGEKAWTKTVTRREVMLGNPAYLAGVERCIAERCKLLGLYAPVKTAADLAEQVIASGITPEAFIGELRKQWQLEQG